VHFTTQCITLLKKNRVRQRKPDWVRDVPGTVHASKGCTRFLQARGSEKVLFDSIVLDVGHVLVQGSLLNGMLQNIYPAMKPKVLYDPSVIIGASKRKIDAWVEATMTEKIELLSSCSVSELIDLSAMVPATPHARELLLAARNHGLSVLCVGAVPDFLIGALLDHLGVDVPFVGTRVHVKADRIIGVGSVLTPTKKMKEVRKWMDDGQMNPAMVAVVGDSLGDIEMMKLVPRRNRIAFNATQKDVLDFCARSYASSMDKLLEGMFYE